MPHISNEFMVYTVQPEAWDRSRNYIVTTWLFRLVIYVTILKRCAWHKLIFIIVHSWCCIICQCSPFPLHTFMYVLICIWIAHNICAQWMYTYHTYLYVLYIYTNEQVGPLPNPQGDTHPFFALDVASNAMGFCPWLHKKPPAECRVERIFAAGKPIARQKRLRSANLTKSKCQKHVFFCERNTFEPGFAQQILFCVQVCGKVDATYFTWNLYSDVRLMWDWCVH